MPMLDDLRYRLAHHAALRAARQRSVVGRPPLDAKVLMLLPHDEERLRAAWRFIQSLDDPKRSLVLVLTDERVPYTPDAFAAAVHTVGKAARDWRGLPGPSVLAQVWSAPLRLALDLTPDFDLASAYLVGASPASFRAGLYSAEREPFCDLLVRSQGGYEAALQALRSYLGTVEPPVLSFR